MGFLWTLPAAFVLYLVLVGILTNLDKFMAGVTRWSPLKTTTYASGEAPPDRPAAPGYRPFFKVAMFFAVLHLGVLVLGTGLPSAVTGAYVVGLGVALLVLIAG